MSHVTRIRTRLKIHKHLIAALGDLGLPFTEDPSGTLHVQTAFRPLVLSKGNDGYELRGYEESIVGLDKTPLMLELTQRYAYHVAREQLEAQGFALASEEKQPDGRLHLVMRRMS